MSANLDQDGKDVTATVTMKRKWWYITGGIVVAVALILWFI